MKTWHSPLYLPLISSFSYFETSLNLTSKTLIYFSSLINFLITYACILLCDKYKFPSCFILFNIKPPALVILFEVASKYLRFFKLIKYYIPVSLISLLEMDNWVNY